MTEDGSEEDFLYDAAYGRMRTELWQGGALQRTRYYLGDYEENVSPGGMPSYVHYIPGGDGVCAIVSYTPSGFIPVSYYYVCKDHLGSILTATDASGSVVMEQNFDAWGRSRNAADWTYNGVPGVSSLFYRGYTGHEHMPEFTLINMNGRMYDPVVGRMLSPDNYVQGGTQGYNRYTYALNNPLKYTDPSGDFVVAAVVIGAAIGAFSGWQIGEAHGAKGWDMVGYIAGGAAIGGVAGYAGGAVAGALGNGIGAAAAGGATGGFISGAGNTWLGGGNFGQGLAGGLKGSIVGGIGGGFGVLGGGSFLNNMAYGMVGGIVTGGIGAALSGGDIGMGMLYGAAAGAAFAGITSGIEAYGNYRGGYGFRTNHGVIKSYIRGGQYQDAINFVQNRYGLSGVDIAYDETPGAYGSTSLDGNIKIGDAAFKSPSVLKATMIHEYTHSISDRVFINGQW